jgi:hypothetical protein
MLYTKLKHLTPEIKQLTNLGVVDPVWLRNIEIVERFFELRAKDVCVYCCYDFIGEEYGVSGDTVKKVVARLTK